MWRLHRYYLRELVVNAGITFLVMFGLVLVSLIPQIIQRTQGGDLLDAAKMTILFALDSFPHLLSVAFLIATVLTYSRAAQDRELVAIRAAGISPRVAMAPASLVGILLSVLCSVAMHYAIPDIHFNKYRVIADVVRTAFTSLQLDTDRITLGKTGYVLTFRTHEGSEYRDCTIYCPPDRLPKDLKSPILRVERVSIPPIDEYSDNFVVLLQGVSEPVFGLRGGDVPIQIPIRDLSEDKRRSDRDDDLRSDQLLSEVMRGVHAQPVGAVYTLFRRCCFALLPALLGPIGFCIAELARERGRVMALVMALVPLAMFYLGEVFGARLLIATNNPWSAWLPAVLLLAVGTPLCWRQLRR